jgi:serine/threonine-protein kinase
VKDIDPGVERVILHCLAPDPADRPDSATAVAMALPGGDPLAAALAAGETPSPEMVAGAGATIGISVRGAVSCLAVLVLSLIAGSWLGDRGLISGDASLDLPPEVLAAKAREIARSLGYQGKPRDRAFRMAYDTDYIRHLSSTNDRRPMRDRRPSPIYFWYRESPVPLLPGSLGGVKYLDPPATLPGMLALQLDSAGYLIQLRAVPEPASPTPQPFENWTTLFAAAGLELRDFEEIGPQWAPPLLPDARKAWKGNYPGQPEPPVRVEAGTVAGRIAYFRVFHPWTNPRDSEPARTVSVRTGSTAFASSPGTAIWWWAFSLLASGLALHNLRNGRGDRRGAFRVAMYIFLMQLAQATAAGDLAHPFERELLAVYRSVMLAVQVWLAYIGLEPLARRIWPQTLISWSRLLAGRWRDPLLGRDLLIGVAAGCAFTATVGMLWIAAPSGTLVRTAGYALPAGLGSFIDMIVTPMCAPLFIGFTFVVSISAIWLVLGRRWAAAILGWMICTVAFSSIGSGVQPRAVIWTIAAAITGLFVVLLVRVGVTAMVAANFAVLLNFSLLGGWDLSAWHQQPGRLNALLLLALGVYAFHTALAGRPILGAKLDER